MTAGDVPVPVTAAARKRKRTTLTIDGGSTSSALGTVRPEFLSYTLDWWPPTEPGWEGSNSNILTLDLTHPRLIGAASALSPFFLRIGGWEADRIVYLFEDDDLNLSPTAPERDYCRVNPHFCLTSERWDAILQFAEKVGARIVFCLAYLMYIDDETKAWDGANARTFLTYTKHRAPAGLLFGVELGNEPLHKGRSTNVTRHVLAYAELRDMIDEIWSSSSEVEGEGEKDRHKPKLMGPATTGVNRDTFQQFLSYEDFCDAIDIVTYHDYRCGSGRNEELSSEAIQPRAFGPHNKLHHAAKLVHEGLPHAELWIGEGSMAYNSGRAGVTDSLQNSFWYGNLLGQLSKTRHMTHSVFCRQALVGGWYDILSHSNDLIPNPDFWVAVLWKELMGTTSLYSKRVGCCQEGTDRLIVHAFCARYDSESKYDVQEGDVAMILLNISNDTSYEVTMDDMSDVWDAESRLEFLLEAHVDSVEKRTPENPLSAREVTVNGQKMTLDDKGTLPDIEPFEKHDADSGMVITPYSIMFAVLRGSRAPLCISKTRPENIKDTELSHLKGSVLNVETSKIEQPNSQTISAKTQRSMFQPSPQSRGDFIFSERVGIVGLAVISFGGLLIAMKQSSKSRSDKARKRKARLHYSR